MSWVFVATAAFLGECVPLQAAGAFALGNMLRNPGAAIAAVLYPPLVGRMGIAWFFTGFAVLDLVLVGGSVLGESSPASNLIALLADNYESLTVPWTSLALALHRSGVVRKFITLAFPEQTRHIGVPLLALSAFTVSLAQG